MNGITIAKEMINITKEKQYTLFDCSTEWV